MGGGLMQLVAYGAQDIYLTGNPQITFFKVVYRRHTNFSMEAIKQTWSGNNGLSGSGSCTATISRNGDLVHRMYLEIITTGMNVNDGNVSSKFIKDIELEIGGQKIDKHTGDWMNVWSQLTELNPTGAVSGADVGSGRTLFQNMSGLGGSRMANTGDMFTVPLMFWFCRNPGLSLPLIALQYHEVKVILNHASLTNGTITRNDLYADYIYLDTDERRRFAQVSHEYLIEQLQINNVSGATDSSSLLTFNHPVKELIFTNDTPDQHSGRLFTTGTGGSVKLKLNGHDRFAERNIRYFTRTQIWQHHSGPGGLCASDPSTSNLGFNDSIGVYSFSLKPEEHQPSGTCNFSRIDNAQFVQNGAVGATTVYAVNYNVLRIMSGMGGLAYSN